MQLQTLSKKNTVSELLHSLHYSNIEEAGYEMLLLSAQNQYAEYLSETRKFENKYQMTFEEFQKKMEETLYKEDFDEEDDYMDWKFACDGVCYWKEKITELNSCF
ncbi:Uncharacterized protein dnl_14390 [Desulfonema limicola]|uniref:Uncharacterized protein n=1 Tax=Desulfonema limicola TaxID=45656 RepID=A0A975GFH4_9BACT|nr:hypothetical protein [Desulfonema limicola]QTA79185.1 Uncharacterized protein dnl_14390 [Desulfonema limicola]